MEYWLVPYDFSEREGYMEDYRIHVTWEHDKQHSTLINELERLGKEYDKPTVHKTYFNSESSHYCYESVSVLQQHVKMQIELLQNIPLIEWTDVIVSFFVDLRTLYGRLQVCNGEWMLTYSKD